MSKSASLAMPTPHLQAITAATWNKPLNPSQWVQRALIEALGRPAELRALVEADCISAHRRRGERAPLNTQTFSLPDDLHALALAFAQNCGRTGLAEVLRGAVEIGLGLKVQAEPGNYKTDAIGDRAAKFDDRLRLMGDPASTARARRAIASLVDENDPPEWLRNVTRLAKTLGCDPIAVLHAFTLPETGNEKEKENRHGQEQA